jgi:hypothetical protein
LAKARDIAGRDGWCYQHVQATIVVIEQYAERPRVTGNIFRTTSFNWWEPEGLATAFGFV